MIIFLAGIAAGILGAALGIGGGVFLVPLLNLGLGFSITAAAAISLATVIATSTTVTAGRVGGELINVRLAMVLESATAAGSVLGGVTAQLIAQSTLQKMFGLVAAIVALTTLARSSRRNVTHDVTLDPGILGARIHDDDTGQTAVYRVRRLPLAVAASFVAGNISSLLGIGGGIVKVPVLNAWCGIPLRAAAATSAFMIGVTATGGALIYYGSGQLVPSAAAAAVLGVQVGSWAGIRAAGKVPVRVLKLTLSAVLAVVSILMLVRGFQ